MEIKHWFWFGLGLIWFSWGLWKQWRSEPFQRWVVEEGPSRLRGLVLRSGAAFELQEGDWVRISFWQGAERQSEWECEGPGRWFWNAPQGASPVVHLGALKCQLVSLTPGVFYWIQSAQMEFPEPITQWAQRQTLPEKGSVGLPSTSWLNRWQGPILACLESQLNRWMGQGFRQVQILVQAHKPLLSKDLRWWVESQPAMEEDASNCVRRVLSQNVKPKLLPGYTVTDDLIWRWPLVIQW